MLISTQCQEDIGCEGTLYLEGSDEGKFAIDYSNKSLELIEWNKGYNIYILNEESKWLPIDTKKYGINCKTITFYTDSLKDQFKGMIKYWKYCIKYIEDEFY